MSWAEQGMGHADLGDQRLNRRAAVVLEQLGAKPGLSIPAACRGWHENLAAYRFFDQAEVNVPNVLAPQFECTLEQARRHPVVLGVQDTTELDYTGESDIQGLGPLNYEAQQRPHCHPTLLLTPERVPLGVTDAWIWARDPEIVGESARGLPIEGQVGGAS